MSRAKQNKVYNVFLKGLITEATQLTYPENSTSAESNMTLARKGGKSRRLGIDFEVGGSVSSLLTSTVNTAITEYKWESAAGQAGLDYLVVQTGLTISFFELSTGPVSTGYTSLNVDLTSFVRDGELSPTSKQVSFAAGRGYLFVVGEHIEPLIISYDRSTNTMSAAKIFIQIRDFQGLDDGLANDEEPTTLSDPHKYNLLNQGWVTPSNSGAGASVTYYSFFGKEQNYASAGSAPITSYYASQSRYPPNSKQWFMAKDAQDDFDPVALSKIYTGNNRAPRGHFVVNAFNLDRAAVSGISGLTPEITYERPRAVSFFSGRVWYATNSTVYFSQVLDDKRKAGFCYQEADPTSEDISDLIATDGGVVPIPEMSKALRLVPSGAGVLVFATNGIWMISGTSSGFTATDISVSKVSPIGTDSPNSIIEAEGQFYWWSKVGIMGMSQKIGVFGPVEGSFERSNISEMSVQTLYNNIPFSCKPYVKGAYDPATNTATWMYGESPGYTYNNLLHLDLTLQAFYPWKISSNSTTPWLVGVFNTTSINDIEIDLNRQDKLSFLKFMSIHPVEASQHIGFSSFRNTHFLDWGTENYESFFETGYELLGDTMRDKQITYLVTYFRQTEETFTVSGEGYTPTHQSSCFFQTKWDWADSRQSNRWSNRVQAYRPLFGVVNTEDLSVDTGFAVVTTKHKVRGHGRSIQFRFSCDEPDRDFEILGWSVQYSGNTDV